MPPWPPLPTYCSCSCVPRLSAMDKPMWKHVPQRPAKLLSRLMSHGRPSCPVPVLPPSREANRMPRINSIWKPQPIEIPASSGLANCLAQCGNSLRWAEPCPKLVLLSTGDFRSFDGILSDPNIPFWVYKVLHAVH